MLQQYISKGATLTLKAKLFLAPVFLVPRLSEHLLRVCRQAGVSCANTKICNGVKRLQTSGVRFHSSLCWWLCLHRSQPDNHRKRSHKETSPLSKEVHLIISCFP